MPKRINFLDGVGGGPLQPSQVNANCQLGRDGKAPRIYGHGYVPPGAIAVGLATNPATAGGGGTGGGTAGGGGSSGVSASAGFARLTTVSGAVSALAGPNDTVVTSAYTVAASDDVIEVNASGGAVTVTLTAGASTANRLLVVIKTDSSTNGVTIAAAGADTINGASTFVIGTQYQAATLYSDGTGAWYLCSSPSGITVTDGTTTLTGVTKVTFSGATVTGTSPNGTVTITGGGGSPYTPPAPSGFTAVNTPSGFSWGSTSTGTTIVSTTSPGLTMFALQDNTAPGSTFTITIGLYSPMSSGNCSVFLWAMDSSGKVIQWGLGSTSGETAGNLNYWNSFTSFNNNPANYTYIYPVSFLQIKYDGTNLYYNAGSDLHTMLVFATTALTAFLGGVPTQVGIGAFAYTATLAGCTIFDYSHTA